MEVKLESLIEKIKRDGVGEARKASGELIKNAQEQAAKVIDDARIKAANLIEEAEKEAVGFEKNAEDAIKQAGRDLVLNLKEELTKLFDRILKRDFSEHLTPEFLKQLIVKIIDNWSPGENSSLEIITSSQDKKKLEELLFSHFKDEAKNTITIKASSNIDKGFRIGIKGEDVHYDFSDESILESLKEILTPSISRILDGDKKS